MIPLNIPALEQEAHRLHAVEIQHEENAAASPLNLYAHWMGAATLSSLVYFTECLRPLFSWNPDE